MNQDGNHRNQLYLIPFLHQTTTYERCGKNSGGCILFHFYIKPQPARNQLYGGSRCILFHFYIKPQRLVAGYAEIRVVSYSISTSNHNPTSHEEVYNKLYLIPFLHQTTTRCKEILTIVVLYLIPFLHQTTTYGA